jgi:cytochrome c553
MAFTISRLAVAPAVFALVLSALGTAAARADEAPPAGDAKRGEHLAYTCFGCHGIPDYRNAYPAYHVPKLGGQHVGYLVAALTEYRAGTRANSTMHGQAATLSDADIRDIAAYLSGEKPLTSAGKAPAPPAAVALCASCHGPDGVAITDEYPSLAGQHADYLEQAVKAYRKGTRQNAIMTGFAATLKDDDITAIAHYFAQQSPGLWVPLAPHAPK